MGPERCSATKNWVELNSAVGFRTSLGFQQGFCFFHPPLRSEWLCVAELSRGFADKHRRGSRRFSGKIRTQERSGPLRCPEGKRPAQCSVESSRASSGSSGSLGQQRGDQYQVADLTPGTQGQGHAGGAEVLR